jgi:hypothetical protein
MFLRGVAALRASLRHGVVRVVCWHKGADVDHARRRLRPPSGMSDLSDVSSMVRFVLVCSYMSVLVRLSGMGGFSGLSGMSDLPKSPNFSWQLGGLYIHTYIRHTRRVFGEPYLWRSVLAPGMLAIRLLHLVAHVRSQAHPTPIPLFPEPYTVNIFRRQPGLLDPGK